MPDLDTMTGKELNLLYHQLKGWHCLTGGYGSNQWFLIAPPEIQTSTWGYATKEAAELGMPQLHQAADLLIAELDKTFPGEWSISRETMSTVQCCAFDKVLRNDFYGQGTGQYAVCEAGLRALIEFWQLPNKGVTITDAQAPTSGTRS